MFGKMAVSHINLKKILKAEIGGIALECDEYYRNIVEKLRR
jgi:hypothetical protein